MLAALLLPSLLAAGAEDPVNAVQLKEPKVQYRNNEASATRQPWVDANGWRLARNPSGKFVYHVKGEAAALAAAEAFTYGNPALISTDGAGATAFGKMLEFLQTIPPRELPPVADFGFVDDASDTAGELLNLLTRMNLLYQVENHPDRHFKVNVVLGSKQYPRAEATNPSFLAHKIRSQIGDDNRSLRLYGSEVVVGRYLAASDQARVFLINYSPRPILGLRVRVRGIYAKGQLREPGSSDSQLADFVQDGPATEFTVPELHVFAVIDVSRN